jgi:hypothetical protein
MNHNRNADINIAQNYFVWLKRSRGEQVYRRLEPNNARHVCHADCKLVEVPASAFKSRLTDTHFVCDFSQNVHVCGASCNVEVPLPRREGYVCRLTGRVLPHTDMVRENNAPGNDDGARTSYGKRPSGVSYTRMGTVGRKPAAKRPPTANRGKIVADIYNNLLAVLNGPDRVAMYNAQVARFNKEVVKIVKKTADKNTIQMAVVENKVLSLRIKFGFFLNPPAIGLDKTEAKKLAETLYAYSQQITPYIDKKITGKTVSTFTAFMTQQLSKGYSIDGVVIIPKIPLFHSHVPASIQ